MNTPEFLAGNEAVAQAVRLCRPRVIAAYPITPQTTVVERLSEIVEAGELDAEFVHVESEHSALALLMGSAAMGSRTFTATSSQGLLYMAECLYYASGGRWPLVMMNANRALALPWNIYGDQSDSLALVSAGWVQAYAENAQEALDMIIQAYAVAEDPAIRTPVLVNLDGFVLTHTYEPVSVPEQAEVDAFLPPRDLPDGFPGTFRADAPQSLAITAGPGDYTVFKYQQHAALLAAAAAIRATAERFRARFGRGAQGLVEAWQADDAEFVLITLGSIAGSVRSAIRALREQGVRAGLLRLRYLRPFPAEELGAALFGSQRSLPVRAVGVLEKDISFGHQGSVSLEVKAALYEHASRHRAPAPPVLNFVAGLGGQEIALTDLHAMFADLQGLAHSPSDDRRHLAAPGFTDVRFAGMERFLEENQHQDAA
ncbi:MAG: pyruvate ferredoxin oxidoreductase [Candidatus Dactylopiibacterium sp.]|nr:pyruvate ferredoxin oxidoreductase [Candidatus Dactylopiibacterium sp.]